MKYQFGVCLFLFACARPVQEEDATVASRATTLAPFTLTATSGIAGENQAVALADDGSIVYVVNERVVGLAPDGTKRWEQAGGFPQVVRGVGAALVATSFGSGAVVREIAYDGSSSRTRVTLSGGAEVQIHSISTNAAGTLAISGMYNGDVDFDPGLGVKTLGGIGAFVATYRSTGELLWVAKATTDGLGARAFGKRVAIASDGSVYAFVTTWSGALTLDAVATYQGSVVARWMPNGRLDWYRTDVGNFTQQTDVMALETAANGDALIGTRSRGGSSVHWAGLTRVRPDAGVAGMRAFTCAGPGFPSSWISCGVEGFTELPSGKTMALVNYWSDAIGELPAGDLQNMALVQLDATAATVLWTRALVGDGYERGMSLSANASGDVALVGTYYSGHTVAWSTAPRSLLPPSAGEASRSIVARVAADGSVSATDPTPPAPPAPWRTALPMGGLLLHGSASAMTDVQWCSPLYGGPPEQPFQSLNCSRTASAPENLTCEVTGTNPGDIYVSCATGSRDRVAADGTFAHRESDLLGGLSYSGRLTDTRDVVLTSYVRYRGDHDPWAGWYHGSETTVRGPVTLPLLR